MSLPKRGRSFCPTSRSRSCAGGNWSTRPASPPRTAAAPDSESRPPRRQRHAVDVLDLGQQQTLDHPGTRRKMSRIVPKIFELARIVREIVEFAPAGAVEHA